VSGGEEEGVLNKSSLVSGTGETLLLSNGGRIEDDDGHRIGSEASSEAPVAVLQLSLVSSELGELTLLVDSADIPVHASGTNMKRLKCVGRMFLRRG